MALQHEREEKKSQLLQELQEGQIRPGRVSGLSSFGAFVDLGGADGLIHISELSWSHVNHPSEVVAIGDTVRIKVLDIDRDRQRISLGLKQTQEDPWQRVVDTYNVGDELEGTVTKVVTFGAFVEILDGVEGLVHISELAPHHVENPREIVAPGDDVKVKILEIDSERRRLSLSVKRVEGQVLEPKVLPPEELESTDDGGLSEEAFVAAAPVTDDDVADSAAETLAEPEAEVAEAEAVAEPAADTVAEPAAEVVAEPEAETVEPEAVEPEAVAVPDTVQAEPGAPDADEPAAT
ncbi:MAG: S1 RNA-binding domain-containing protein [Solirubrobacteraceae bacterium]|nr:S1 RNA-binding domain-containing protein [Solirubrobacteraceae bacterium]